MLSENTVNAMEKRRTWKNELGPLFEDKNMTMPTKSIYEDQEEEETTPPVTDTTTQKSSNNSNNNNDATTQEQS